MALTNTITNEMEVYCRMLLVVWMWGGEGDTSLETPNTIFNQIMLQGETLNQPLLYLPLYSLQSTLHSATFSSLDISELTIGITFMVALKLYTVCKIPWSMT